MARGVVSFELERFGWTGGGSVLEVAGRWRGPRPRRLGPAILAVEVRGRRRVAPAIVTGDARADPEPTLWRAEYPWDGGAVGSYELEVGPSLVIELPAPEGSPPDTARSDSARTDPVHAQLEAAHRQIEADRGETERLRGELVALRRDAFELEQAKESLGSAQATAEAELEAVLKAVRAAREGVAAGRAAASEAGGQPKTGAELAREETKALRSEVEQLREAAAAALREAERAREELVVARASAGAAGDELLEREQALERERDAAIEEARGLRDQLAAAEAHPVAQPDPPTEPMEAAPDPPAPTVPIPGRAARSASTRKPSTVGSPTPEPEEEATDTVVLESPRRRTPVHQYRERVFVVPQRTAPAPRRYAERPPRDSPALRAIAAVLLLMLLVVLVTVLVIVA